MQQAQLTGDGPWALIFDSDHPPYSAGMVATNGNRDTVAKLLSIRHDRERHKSGPDGFTKMEVGVPVCRLASPQEVAIYGAKVRAKPKKPKLVPVKFGTDVPPFSAGMIGWVPPQRALDFCESRSSPQGIVHPVAEPVDPVTLRTAAEQADLDEPPEPPKAEKPRRPARRRKRRKRASMDEKGAPEKK